MITYTLMQLTHDYVLVGLFYNNGPTVEMKEAILYRHVIRDRESMGNRIQMYLSARLTGMELKDYTVWKESIIFCHHFRSD